MKVLLIGVVLTISYLLVFELRCLAQVCSSCRRGRR